MQELFSEGSECLELVHSLFGEENVDLVDSSAEPIGETASNGVLIRIPELILTNEENEKHTIYNFFVHIYFSIGGSNREVIFRGKKLTFTHAEVIQEYCHSHCTGSTKDWGNFCQGATMGTMINAITRSGISTESRFTAVKLMLATLPTYLSSESIVGGPFQRHNNIYELSNLYVTSESNFEANEFRNVQPGELKFKVDEGGNFQVTDITPAAENSGLPRKLFVEYYSPSLNQAVSASFLNLTKKMTKVLKNIQNGSKCNLNYPLKFKGGYIFPNIIPDPVIEDLEPTSTKLSPFKIGNAKSCLNNIIHSNQQNIYHTVSQNAHKSQLETLKTLLKNVKEKQEQASAQPADSESATETRSERGESSNLDSVFN